MRWQPPPADERNGMITGYKIRYKKDGDRKGAAVTEDANQRSFALNGRLHIFLNALRTIRA